MNDELRELNEMARRLLAFLHSFAIKVGGRPFSIAPHDPETFKATGLDAETYMKAGSWLVRKSLAKWKGSAQQLTITETGIDVAADDWRLDRELPIVGAVKQPTEKVSMTIAPDKRSVFIIHGRNVAARDAVEQFLRALDLVPVDFDQLAADMGTEFVGNIVLEGLKRAHGIVALFTPDEYAGLFTMFRGGSSGTEILRWQSRPNVLFEAGIAFGTARDRTVLVTLGEDVSLFSDVSGIHILRLSNDLESRKKFRQKLIGIKCAVDQRADSYTDPARSGDFAAPVAGLVGVSPLDPFRPSSAAANVTAATPPDPEAIRLYVLVCGMQKRVGDDWLIARQECNNLHARLGGDRRAAYAATTAYAWFINRDTSDKGKMAQFQAAQERVEANLRDPSAPFDMPADDVICAYARTARDGLGNPLWLRL